MTIDRFGKSFLCSASILALAVAAQAQNSSSVNTEMVTVTASRLSDVAQQQQINALNIIDVQSAEAMAKYPDYNAAEALGRMPGISVSEDTGEGRYVTIRGLDGNLDGATGAAVIDCLFAAHEHYGTGLLLITHDPSLAERCER